MARDKYAINRYMASFFKRILYKFSMWRKIKLWYKRRNCKHTHTFTYSLDGATREYGVPHGSRTCKTPGLELKGCYICGKVYVNDYRA